MCNVAGYQGFLVLKSQAIPAHYKGGCDMFKLTKVQIVRAGRKAWKDFPPYIREDYLPRVIYLCTGNIDPYMFDVIIVALIEASIPIEDRELVLNEVPVFIRNLGLGEEGEEAIGYLPLEIM